MYLIFLLYFLVLVVTFALHHLDYQRNGKAYEELLLGIDPQVVLVANRYFHTRDPSSFHDAYLELKDEDEKEKEKEERFWPPASESMSGQVFLERFHGLSGSKKCFREWDEDMREAIESCLSKRDEVCYVC